MERLSEKGEGGAPRRRGLVCCLVALVLAGCGDGNSGGGGGDGGSDSDGLDASADGGDEAGDADGPDGEPIPGELTLVVETAEIILDRRCDMDGDGQEDNALADLGDPFAAMFAMAVNAAIGGSGDNSGRFMIHLPWVDDLRGPSDPETVLIFFDARDGDEPPDPDDDYSGEETFFVRGDSLDACGEPRHYSTTASLDGGAIAARSIVLGFSVANSFIGLNDTRVDATVVPGGASFEAFICGYGSLEGLGAHQGFLGSGLTVLEELTMGGGAFGVDTVPGLSMDVDIDGDGLERLVLDEDGHIVSCVDGDMTSIPGEDCWLDERMVDGYSFNFRLTGTGARFGGFEPQWYHRIDGVCEEGFPEVSLFDSSVVHEGPCVGLYERCDPLLGEDACCDPSHRCDGLHSTVHRCSPPCVPSPCDYGTRPGYCEHQPELGDDEGYCFAAARPVTPAPCELGERGCETEYGESGDTHCLPQELPSTMCLERCAFVADDCYDEGHACYPLRFEPTEGVCLVVP